MPCTPRGLFPSAFTINPDKVHTVQPIQTTQAYPPLRSTTMSQPQPTSGTGKASALPASRGFKLTDPIGGGNGGQGGSGAGGSSTSVSPAIDRYLKEKQGAWTPYVPR